MGLTKKSELKSYWSTNPIHHMPKFSAVMAWSRYIDLMRFLHFNNNTLCPKQDGRSQVRLNKLRPLITHFNKLFPEVYMPQKHIAIDKSISQAGF